MKKYAIGILAVAFAFAGAAFTAKKATPAFQKPTTTQFYYSYNLNTVAGENTASNYSLMDPQPDPEDIQGCGGSTIPCVILAEGGSHPNDDEVSSANLDNNTVAKKNAQ